MAKDDKTMTESIEPTPEAAVVEPTIDPTLVEVHKDGVTLFVHGSCVAAHKDAGWKPVVR